MTKSPGSLIPTLLLAVSLAATQGLSQVTIKNPGAAKTDAVVTFGMIFKPGDIPTGKSPALAGADAYQVDVKAAHGDGSVRHAVVSAKFASLAVGGTKTLSFSAAAPAGGTALAAADVLKTAFDAVVTVTVGGTAYTASAKDHLAAAKTWLAGPLCTEWLITAPLKSAAGAAHPHLHVRMAVRAYEGLKRIRADITVENDWTFEPNPAGFTYDAKIAIAGADVYTKAGLAHTHHARWRKVFWWGGDPALDWEYDRDYLFGTGAFPNFNKGVKLAAATILALKTEFEPMENGRLESYMPGTGAHSDIGPLPDFAALYLISQDPKARASVLANGACGGSFQIHYRDKAKDMPVSLDDFPYMTILGNPSDTKNPVTGLFESFPAVTNGLTKHDPDDAHQPSIAFLPYAISGDYFYLEELQFWANWNMVLGNPGYRKDKQGLLFWGQNRAQAWSMRTLAHAAYITPDAHALKKYFVEKLGNNINFYVDRYPKGTAVNPMGYLDGQFPYLPFGIAPWMDDFFTFSMGYIVQLGFTAAQPLAVWKSKFVVGRMSDPGYCWLQASAYSLQVGLADKVPFKTWAEIYKANFPASTGCAGVKMDGYPDAATGYGANMQPALAAAVDVAAPGAKEAWDKYQTRNPKQDYSSQPQWDVLPRSLNGGSPVLARGPGRVAGAGRPAPSLFLPGTKLAFALAEPAEVFLEVYDTNGRQRFTAILGARAKGRHVVDPSRDLPRREWGTAPCLIRLRASAAARPAAYLPLLPAP